MNHTPGSQTMLLFLGIATVCGQAAGLPGLLLAYVSMVALAAAAARMR